MRTPPVREHQHSHYTLPDKEGFGQDQRGAEAAAGWLFPKVRHQAPDANEGRNQQPGAEEAIVKEKQEAHKTFIIVGA